MKRIDYLPGANLKIIQDENMYHFNGDTVLLGSFMHIKKKDRVLDVGCNNGALLLYASRFHPKSLCGIDLFEEVLNVAKENFDLHHLQGEFYQAKLQDFKHARFDVILANPPYFKTQANHLKNENPYIKAARHEEYLQLEDLFFHVHRLMMDNGRFYFVHRAKDYNRIIRIAIENHLSPKCVQFAYDHVGGKAKACLIEFRMGIDLEVEFKEPIYLDQPIPFSKVD